MVHTNVQLRTRFLLVLRMDDALADEAMLVRAMDSLLDDCDNAKPRDVTARNNGVSVAAGTPNPLVALACASMEAQGPRPTFTEFANVPSANPFSAQPAVDAEGLLSALSSDDPQARAAAAEDIASLDGSHPTFAEAAIRALVVMLGDEHNAARRPAANALGALRAYVCAPVAKDVVQKLADEENAPYGGGAISVRRAALLAFTALCQPIAEGQGVPAAVSTVCRDLTALLAHDNVDAREMAARAMAALEEHADLHALVNLFADEEPDVRSAAVDSLVRLRGHADADVASAVATLLTHEEEDVRVVALSALGSLGGNLAAVHVGAMSDLLCDEEQPSSVTVAAIASLAAFGDGFVGPEVVDSIASRLEDPQPEVRAAAATGLGDLKVHAHADTIAEMAADSSKMVRTAATAACKRLEQEAGDNDRK